MDAGLLIAQAEHGPQMHGGIVPILLAIALVVGVAYLVIKHRRSPDRDRKPDRTPPSDPDPEPSERSRER